ncbi:MAG TPA: hypothetical protein DCM14_00975 [Clostridiales bacterium UBA8153]|nr:hypothetical protein [Clostridiales bacterium UBA8153]
MTTPPVTPVPRGVEVFRSVNPLFLEASQDLAESLYRDYREAVPELPARGVRTRTRGSDGRDRFHVLRESPVPAVLLEGAFLTNAADAALLRLKAFACGRPRDWSTGSWLGSGFRLLPSRPGGRVLWQLKTGSGG